MIVTIFTLINGEKQHLITLIFIQTERNDTNFLESGPYMALPLPHPTRIVNILFGSLYMVVVPFVYYCIFRYNDDGGFYDGEWWQ